MGVIMKEEKISMKRGVKKYNS